jgi:hypothetical protein
MDAVGARRVRTGKAVEKDTTLQAMEAGLHIASGVKMYVPNIDLAFELDLVVLDPSTGGPVIVENKSIYGYMANTQILGNKGHKGEPKLEHVLQTLIYINEIRTGAVLKQAIADSLAERSTNPRNRTEVTQSTLAMIKDEDKVYGKICYETRDSCLTAEFDVEIYEDFDGYHYPQINGNIWKIFTVESIYERYEVLQGYFNRAQAEAIRILASRGVVRHERGIETTDAEHKKNEQEYWMTVGEEMRRLPLEFLPPADYQYRYSDQKVELLASKDLIGQTKYKEWKTWKNGKRRKAGTPAPIGDWNCRYCPYKLQCIPLQCPDLAQMCVDIINTKENEDGGEDS